MNAESIALAALSAFLGCYYGVAIMVQRWSRKHNSKNAEGGDNGK